ncbi:MAG: DUF4258 domain-containing protein [Ignavibacteria bacterium]|nr:DUF4258 domain-containing protein [Ignavibacteria bacterium]
MTQDILEFIKECVSHGRIFWTYHLNLRLSERFIPRSYIIASVSKYEIIESYPNDKYLPSYLVYSKHNNVIFHILFAVEEKNNNVRVITSYKPDNEKWEDDFKTRRIK